MPIIRVTKKQAESARRARDNATGEDAEFRKFLKAKDEKLKEALDQAKKRRAEEAK